MKLTVLLCLLVGFSFATRYGQMNTTSDLCGGHEKLPFAEVAPGFCAYKYADRFFRPRGIVAASNGDVLVVDTIMSEVLVLWDHNKDGVISENERATLIAEENLSHAVIIGIDGFVYASTPYAIFRWKYKVGDRHNLGAGEKVVTDIPYKEGANHRARYLRQDPRGWIFAQTGSTERPNNDSYMTKIRAFPMGVTQIPAGGHKWDDGALVADGCRNSCGFDWDSKGVLWAADNGIDELKRPDLGGDIHNFNPSEEINMITEWGKFYGYPYCWSEYKLDGRIDKPGTQWLDPHFDNDTIHTDEWCRDPSNVVPPAYNIEAHFVPLDFMFYKGGSFPNEYVGDAFITSHGSWAAEPPVGYRVDRLKFDKKTGLPYDHTPMMRYVGPGAKDPKDWTHRPVGITRSKCAAGECLLITSDDNGLILALLYEGNDLHHKGIKE